MGWERMRWTRQRWRESSRPSSGRRGIRSLCILPDEAMLEGLVEEVPEAARKLMKAFWPGPLTLLLPRTPAVPDAVTAGRPLVGVRMPSHPVALELIRRAGVPVAAPSANRFGHISPTTAAHVLDDLDGRIDAVLDAGPTPHGVESTVLDPSLKPDDDLPAGRGDRGADSRDRGAGGGLPESRSAAAQAGGSAAVAGRGTAPLCAQGTAGAGRCAVAGLADFRHAAWELGARLAEAASVASRERPGAAGRDAACGSCRAGLDCGRARVRVGQLDRAGGACAEALRRAARARCRRMHCDSLPAAAGGGLGAAIRDRLQKGRERGTREEGLGNSGLDDRREC